MFYINISNGLLKDSHRERMGAAVWEFMWCIDRITAITDQGIGKVLGGRPIKVKEIACGFPVDERSVRKNLKTLERQGYISIKRAPYGLILTVHKAKKRVALNARSIDRNKTPDVIKTKTLTKTIKRDSKFWKRIEDRGKKPITTSR